jgi:hypothetical protein
LYRKQQAATAIMSWRYDLMKNSMVREGYSDLLAIVKETAKPARLFGVLTISLDGKWTDHMITVLLFSVVNLVSKLVD